jgi:hypothetical protein
MILSGLFDKRGAAIKALKDKAVSSTSLTTTDEEIDTVQDMNVLCLQSLSSRICRKVP